MSSIQRAYKTELGLNNAQITACKRHAGAARWAYNTASHCTVVEWHVPAMCLARAPPMVKLQWCAAASYNWGLVRKQEAYRATGKSPSAIDLHRELNALKQTEVSWMYAVSKCAPQEALRNLETAFAHFFRRGKLQRAGKHRGKLGYPQFKTKRHGLGSLRLTGSIVVFPDAIQLPRLGRLQLKEHGYLPTTGTPEAKILSATVSERAGHWYVSVLVEQEWLVPGHNGPVVGVDLGVKALATLSDGTVIPNPRPLKRRLKTLKRLHRAVSRKVKGSKNRRKAAHRLARLYRKVRNQRQNTLQQLTTQLAKTKSVVVLEDLHVSGMLKNHHLAQAIADVCFGELRRQLLYKAAWYGSRVVLADRWEPSSKTCSGCGWYDETLALSDRTFHCRNPRVPCGLVLDRDLNAALNLAKLAGSSSDNANARGEGSTGQSRAAQVKLPSLKQEPDAFGPLVG
jgi:putative transposase